MKTNKMNWLLILTFFVMSNAVFAQAKKEKLNERFNVNKDVEIEVDTRYADVIFETWSKNEVSVEAYVEGKRVEDALEDWDLSVSGNSSKVRISSSSGYGDATVINLDDLDDLDINIGPIVGGAVSIVEPVMEGIVGPLLESFAGTPLPAEFYNGLGNVKFDHEAYERDGKAYLKRYEKQMEQQFGPDFDKAMDKWEKENEGNCLNVSNIVIFSSIIIFFLTRGMRCEFHHVRIYLTIQKRYLANAIPIKKATHQMQVIENMIEIHDYTNSKTYPYVPRKITKRFDG